MNISLQWRCVLPFLFASLICIAEEQPAPAQATELSKIEALVEAVELSKQTFIRNGEAHSGADAAAHIRKKLEAKKDEIKSARQFIEVCGTKSELSGQPYLVRFEDGKTQPLAEWLTKTLAAIEKPPARVAAAADMNKYLKLLGDDSFEEREKATEALILMGAPALEALEKHEKETADPEVKQRCKQVRAAIGDPNKTAAHVLEAIEKSGATFVRPGGRFLGSTFDGPKFAAHLRTKALVQKFELTRPACEFVEEVAHKSSLRDTKYAIVLPDGTQKDLKDWLAEKLKLPAEAEKK